MSERPFWSNLLHPCDNSMLQFTCFFHFFLDLVAFWSNRVCVEAPKSVNHSSKLTFVEKDSRQDENKNLTDKYKNKPFDETQSETHDTLRGDKPPPVSFPSRKLYTETGQIWFENINSIYLREEMRCWVRGGAAGFKHNRNQTPFRRRVQQSPCTHTKSAFHTRLHVYFFDHAFILCTRAAPVRQNAGER